MLVIDAKIRWLFSEERRETTGDSQNFKCHLPNCVG